MDNYYPEPSSDSAASDEASSQDTSDSQIKDTSDTEYETFLVPKEAFSKDMNPGDTETIECVHVFEDQLECKCVGEQKEEKSEMDNAMEDMGSMSAPESA